MASGTPNHLQEQQLSHHPATFGYGQQQHVPDYYGVMSTENHAAPSARQDMDAIIFESEPHTKMQDALYVPDGSSLHLIKVRAKTHSAVDKLTTKQRKRAKKPAAKQATVPKMQSQPFTLQLWSDEPARSGPFFVLQDPSTNHVDAAPEPQGLGWNFLEGQDTNDEFPNWSVQDELVRGIGSWAGEGP
jgi:hypothetical protein